MKNSDAKMIETSNNDLSQNSVVL